MAIGVEYAAFRWFFAGTAAAAFAGSRGAAPPAPRFALVTVLATLAGFVLASLSGLNPAWAAAAGAVVLAAGSLIRGQDRLAGLVRAVSSVPAVRAGPGLVVEAVVRNGLGAVLARVIPAGSSLPSLLALAGLAALLASGEHPPLCWSVVRATGRGLLWPRPRPRRADRGGYRPEPELRLLLARFAAPAGRPRPPYRPG